MGKHRANESILPLEPGDYERIQPRMETGQSNLAAGNPTSANLALERHYSIGEVAQLWGLSVRTVRKMFGNEPGIVQWGNEESRFRRAYITVRIPESVLLRVHRRLRLVG